jgi:hypothetical protein
MVPYLHFHCLHIDDNLQGVERGKHHGDVNTYLAMQSGMPDYLSSPILKRGQSIKVPTLDVRVLGFLLKALLVGLA